MIPLHDDNPTRRFPVVTVVLIAINVVIYLFVQPHGGEDEAEFLFQRAAIPCEVTTGEPIEFSRETRTLGCDLPAGQPVFPDKGVYLAVLYSMFLHANLLHIGGNMLFLWIFGNNVEERAGPVLYILFYLAAGLIAAMAHILLFRDSPIPVIGASGAIAGVMGGYLIAFPRARVLTLVSFFAIYLPAWLVLGVWFVTQFSISSSNSGVATAAHIGGFIAGLAVGPLLRARKPPPPAWSPPRWDSPTRY